MSEDDADAEERAEAEALAAALDGRAPAQPEVRDALETAQLLRFSGERGALDPARGEAVLQALLQRAEGAQAAQRKARVIRLWPLGVGLSTVAAAAAALLYFASAHAPMASEHAPSGRAESLRQEHARALPRPSAQLLAAQTELVRDGGSAQRFEQAMRGYRSEVFRALEAAYPAPLSALSGELRRRR
jgi:hypothetical protein